MTGWAFVCLVVPPLAALLSGLLVGPRTAAPWLVVGLNALMPGSGLAAARRPLVEVVAAVVAAMVCLIAVGGFEDIAYWIPIMVIGGAWGMLYTPWNPLTRPRSAARPTPVFTPKTSPREPVKPVRQAPSRQPPSPTTADAAHPEEDAGYSVVVPCTECGAGIEVPVLQHMAHCPFCGTDHLVVGHEDTLYLTVPERIHGEDELRAAILDHYRYRHYLKLYQRSVAPLERSATESSPQGLLTTRSDVEAASAMAEAAISRKADQYRSQLDQKLRISKQLHFVAPYRHGVGTMYQAAFGRSRSDQEKELRFAIATLEAAVLATSEVKLPAMGKLSYLRALLPAAKQPRKVRSLTLDVEESALEQAYGDLDRKQLVRDIAVIRQGYAFSQEITAVVWRPWWIAEAQAPGIRDTLLVDSAAGSVAGPAPFVNPRLLEDLPSEARDAGSGLHFLPMQCPTCGFDFPFDINALMHFCVNCHRLCGVEGGRKHEVEYDHVPFDPQSDVDLVPFWRFPLRIRTTAGHEITDLFHLKDGIDGTLDQIGDNAPMRQHAFFVPAIRCINSRLMVQAFELLLHHNLRHPPPLTRGRYPLDVKPHPWPVSLEHNEARKLAPLFLANIFNRRDLARVNAQQAAAWLFGAQLLSRGRLVYLSIPLAITRPFRRYTGRLRGQALQHAVEGT